MDRPDREAFPGRRGETHIFVILKRPEPQISQGEWSGRCCHNAETDTKDGAKVEPCIIRLDDDRKRRVPKRKRWPGDHEYTFGAPFFERGRELWKTENIGRGNEGKDEC